MGEQTDIGRVSTERGEVPCRDQAAVLLDPVGDAVRIGEPALGLFRLPARPAQPSEQPIIAVQSVPGAGNNGREMPGIGAPVP